MRIRFAARSDEDEALALAKMRERVDAFWRDCGDRVTRSNAWRADPVERQRLEHALTAIARRAAPGIHVELDALEGDEPRVIVAPDSEIGGGLLAEEFVLRAPRGRGLSAARFRPEAAAPAAVADVRARTGIDLERARVRLGFSRGHLLEAVVYSAGFSSAADENARDAAWLLIERLVGEELAHDFVGSVDVAPLPRGGALRVINDGPTAAESTLPLAEVLPAAEAAVRGLYAELPEAPYHAFCEHADWTLLELEPVHANDYGEKDDLVFVSTMLPEATKCFLQGAPFSSSRFSKHGERFVYLKLDTAPCSSAERHELRLSLEDSLNGVLVPGGVGCVVGAGIGLRYLYLDLALQNLDHGVRIACERVRKLGLELPGWALFCDSGWEHEWAPIGLVGPPPMPRKG